jgi:hypothetical protein
VELKRGKATGVVPRFAPALGERIWEVHAMIMAKCIELAQPIRPPHEIEPCGLISSDGRIECQCGGWLTFTQIDTANDGTPIVEWECSNKQAVMKPHPGWAAFDRLT